MVPGQGSMMPSTVRSEVAVFVDFENIRYSTINTYGREPDPLVWRDKALSYGLMAVAKAFADFDQHPSQVRMRLEVAGFEPMHFPAKRTTDNQGREKIVSRSDLNFAVDLINTALVRPDISTFLLFTGDKDFIRVVTTLRNRLGRRIIICGVPGSISPDLVASAGEESPLEMEASPDIDIAVIQAIDAYVQQLHDGFVPTQSHMSRTLWRFLDRDLLSSEHIEAKVMEFLRKGVLTKRQTVNGQQQELVTTELNPSNRLVQEALPGYGGIDVDTAHDPDHDHDPQERELVESHASANGASANGSVPNGSAPNGSVPTVSASNGASPDGYDDPYGDEDPLDNIGNLINPPPMPRR